MSLKDAVTEIADQMEAEAKDILSDDPKDAGRQFTASSLRGFARQLRTACKAAGEVQQVQHQGITTPTMQHLLEIEKAKQEIRAQRRAAEGQEDYEPRMVAVVGGPAATADGVTHHGIAQDMQVGEMIILCDAVYRLKGDGKLHFNEAETEKYRRPKPKTPGGLLLP